MIIEEIVKRRSIRDYLDKPIEKEKLQRVLEAGRLAPTARNAQDWKIVVVDDAKIKNQVVDAASAHQTFLKQAPILFVACGLNTDYIMKCNHPAYLINLAIVLDHISLQAAREGLGTYWIGSFFQEPVKELLKIPDAVQVVQLMSLGYPAAIPSPTPRISLPEFYRDNSW